MSHGFNKKYGPQKLIIKQATGIIITIQIGREIACNFHKRNNPPKTIRPREIDSIKEKFDNVVTIKVERINFETNLSGKEQKHSTETAMDSYEDFDYEITNDTLEKLKEDVYKIYQEETK